MGDESITSSTTMAIRGGLPIANGWRIARSQSARRAFWSLFDQGLSSITNFAVSIVAARELTSTKFGAFTLAFYAYTVALGISYAVVGEPYQVRFSHTGADSGAESARGAATGFLLAFSALAAAVLIILGIVLPRAVEGPLVAVGILLPGLLWQDTVRQFYFAKGLPSWAALNDAIWVAVLGVGLGVMLAHSLPVSPEVLLVIWGAGAWCGAIVGGVHLAMLPRLTLAARWFRENLRLGGSFLVDYAAMVGAAQLVIFLLPAIVGLAAVGWLRGANLLFGPLAIVMYGSRAFGIPEAVRLRSQGARRLRQFEWRFGICLTAVASVYSVAILGIPGSWGKSILGSTWHGASELIPMVALGSLGVALGMGAFQGLRVLGAGGRILRARAIHASITVTLGVFGAAAFGVRGAALGLGTANVVAAGIWIYHFRQASGKDVSGRTKAGGHELAADDPILGLG